ncbi:MAG: hypothetical protein LBC37_01315 [Zoogloeaceae bacterium]|jgi:hypothetical protein|nr:hypothetical protein [Zoogloeaceae bacterium]
MKSDPNLVIARFSENEMIISKGACNHFRNLVTNDASILNSALGFSFGPENDGVLIEPHRLRWAARRMTETIEYLNSWLDAQEEGR